MRFQRKKIRKQIEDVLNMYIETEKYPPEMINRILEIVKSEHIAKEHFRKQRDNAIIKSDTKDFNSNIKAGQEAIELLKELRGFAPYCTDHRQRVDDILSKVSVDMKIIYFQPTGIRPQYCEAGMIHESDTEYIWYLDEPCKILISEVKIIPKERVKYDKKSRSYIVQQSCL